MTTGIDVAPAPHDPEAPPVTSGTLHEPVLIVGGATKAATTSLFAYLADHPDVRPARLKESRFFLAPDEARDRPIDAYDDLFEAKRGARLRVEATSEYLYSRTAASAIHAHLPQARVVFSLREPASRLFSWYRFAKQGGRLEGHKSFAAFVEDELQDRARTPHELDGPLRQGRYSTYLQRFLDELGRDRVHVLFFEDLVADPAREVQALCRFAGLDPTPYDDYRFVSHNPTPNVRNSTVHGFYKRSIRSARAAARSAPWLQRCLRPVRRLVERMYLSVNATSDQGESMGADERARLVEYYTDDVATLRTLLDQPLPWEDYGG